jgi:hypothetical protein
MVGLPQFFQRHRNNGTDSNKALVMILIDELDAMMQEQERSTGESG